MCPMAGFWSSAGPTPDSRSRSSCRFSPGRHRCRREAADAAAAAAGPRHLVVAYRDEAGPGPDLVTAWPAAVPARRGHWWRPARAAPPWRGLRPRVTGATAERSVSRTASRRLRRRRLGDRLPDRPLVDRHPRGQGRARPVRHVRGVTDSPGLYLLGMTWQYTRTSALLGWVGNDATYLADQIKARSRARPGPRLAATAS